MAHYDYPILLSTDRLMSAGRIVPVRERTPTEKLDLGQPARNALPVNASRIRLGAMAGIAGAIITVVAALIGGSPPASDDSTAEVRTYLFDHRDAIRWQAILFALSALFLLWFFASFGALLTRGDGAHPLHAALPMVGFVALSSVGTACIVPMTAVVWRDAPVSDDIVRLVWDINAVSTVGIAMAALVIFGSAGYLMQSSGRFPAWLSWLALLGAVLAVISIFTLLVDTDSPSMAPGGFVSAALPLIVAMIWVIATSVVMLREDAA